MATRFHRESERLARTLAHGTLSLTRFERALFWWQLLQGADAARGISILHSSAHLADVTNIRRVREGGLEAARLAILVDLLLESSRAPNPSLPAHRFSAVIFHWHDWPSFEMDLSAWVSAISPADLRRELQARVDGPDGELALALLSEMPA